MKAYLFKFKFVAIFLVFAMATTGCIVENNNDNNEEPKNIEGNEEVEEIEFCSCLNEENINQTIPIINEFLCGLSNDLDDDEQLEALVTWLKSQPCIIDATLLCQSCLETELPKSEILISFEENGIKKELVIDIAMEKPLRVASYHENKETLSFAKTKWKLEGIVDAETGSIKVLEGSDFILSYTIAFGVLLNNSGFLVDSFYYDNTCYDGSVLHEIGWYKRAVGFTPTNYISFTYRVDYKTCSFRIYGGFGGTLKMEINDGYLFMNTMLEVQSFYFQKNDLKLFYDDRKNYLFFKQLSD